ncbi:MAG: family 16 glycoside hydrolase [Pirellula sp.]
MILTHLRTQLGSITLAACIGALGIAQETKQQETGQTIASASSSAQWAKRDFWQTTDGQVVSDGWEFTDTTVRLAQPGKGGNIVTQPLPSNFELSWKWRIEPGVNGGLKYRVRKFGQELFENSYLGLEYQILDNPSGSSENTSTASIYDLVGPKAQKTLHPPGQWNASKIIALGDRIEHYLNGELVTSAVTVGPRWETLIAFSKFYGSQEFGRAGQQDRFMLTDHGGVTDYKDFEFKPLQPPVFSEPINQGPFLGNATRNSWADQTSVVLWTRTTSLPQMRIDGKAFNEISSKDAAALAKLKDADKLEQSQLPDQAKLEEMVGACPGKAGRVRLSFFPFEQRKDIRSLDWITTKSDNDFTAQWRLEGLMPGTTYITVIEAQSLDGTPSAAIRGSFKTAPAASESRPVKFCITTCHDFIRRDDGPNGHKIYPSMKQIQPDFVVHAGDIEYYDKPAPWALTKSLMRFKWNRIFSLPSNRDFYNHTTSYFIKDDHDTLSNDCWPGKTYGAVTFAEGVKLFNEEQFPSKAQRYQTVAWGKDLQLWILEGRDYRSPNNMPDGPEKTILGAEQKAWLLKTLQESQATYKLICSPTPIVGPDRDNKKDNHANDVFAHEGNQIRDFLSKIPGAIVFCGDRHWQYASVDPSTSLWEFGCGPGSENHELGWNAEDSRPSHRFLRVQGGFLSGELTYQNNNPTPQLKIQHHQVDGKPVSEFVFPQSFKKTDGSK